MASSVLKNGRSLVPQPPHSSKPVDRPRPLKNSSFSNDPQTGRKQANEAPKTSFDFGEKTSLELSPRSSILKNSAVISTSVGRASTDVLAEYTEFGAEMTETDLNSPSPFFRNSVDVSFSPSPPTNSSPRRGRSLSPRSISSSRPSTSKLRLTLDQSNVHNDWATPLSPNASPPRKFHRKFPMAAMFPDQPKANHFFDPTPYFQRPTRPKTAPTTKREGWKSVLTLSEVPKYNAIKDPNCSWVFSPQFISTIKQTCTLSREEELALSQRIQAHAIQEQTSKLAEQKHRMSATSSRPSRLYNPPMISLSSRSPRKPSFSSTAPVPAITSPARPLSASSRDKMTLLRGRKARASSLEPTTSASRRASAPSFATQQRPVVQKTPSKPTAPPTGRPGFASPRANSSSRKLQSQSQPASHSDTFDHSKPSATSHQSSTGEPSEGGTLCSDFAPSELPSGPPPSPPRSASRSSPTNSFENSISTHTRPTDESEPSSSATTVHTTTANPAALEGFEAIEVPIVADDVWDEQYKDDFEVEVEPEDDGESLLPTAQKITTKMPPDATPTGSQRHSPEPIPTDQHVAQTPAVAHQLQPQPPHGHSKDRSPPSTASSASRSSVSSAGGHKPETPRNPSRERDGSLSRRGSQRGSIFIRGSVSEPIDLSKCYDWVHQELPFPSLPEDISGMPPKEALHTLWPMLHCPPSVSEAFAREHLKDGASSRSQMIALSEVNNLLSLHERIFELLKAIHRREELVKSGLAHSTQRVEFLTVSQNVMTILQRFKMDVPWMHPFIYNGVDYLSKTQEYTRGVLAAADHE